MSVQIIPVSCFGQSTGRGVKVTPVTSFRHSAGRGVFVSDQLLLCLLSASFSSPVSSSFLKKKFVLRRKLNARHDRGTISALEPMDQIATDEKP